MPANSVPSAAPLTFEDWFAEYSAEEFGADQRGARFVESIAEDAWNARVPEIDALRERERRLREYLAHKKDCHFYYCRTCDSAAQTLEKRHSRIYYGDHAIDRGHCTCRFAELLAAKEGDE